MVFAEPISASGFHEKIVALYSFEPHKLKDDEMGTKSSQLDLFWSEVKADPSNTLPLLRRELAESSHSAFFYYDGSKLLLSLSKEKSDRDLALRSIPKANLQGVQHTDYLQTVKWFASNGFDTREAAFRILAFPDFKAFIPAHALTLGQDYSLIYMLFPMNESLFGVSDLANRLAMEEQVQSQKSLLLVLLYLATPGGNAVIKAFAGDQTRSAEARAYAKELLGRKAPGRRSVSFPSDKSLREERTLLMRRPISDEALMEFDQITNKLMAKH